MNEITVGLNKNSRINWKTKLWIRFNIVEGYYSPRLTFGIFD